MYDKKSSWEWYVVVRISLIKKVERDKILFFFGCKVSLLATVAKDSYLLPD